MDLSARKLNLIQELLKIDNEDLIHYIEEIVTQGFSKNQKETQTFNLEQLNNRVEKSMQDAIAGKLTSQENLIQEMKEWS